MSTSIEWTNETWNPTRGCSMAKGSENGGCLNCYAARNQLRRPNQTATSGKPFSIMRDSGPRWSGEVELIESKLTEPLHWKTPRRIFVNSMSDLWHDALGWLIDVARVYATMYTADWHEYQILTKRPANRLEAFHDPLFWEAVSHYAGMRCEPGAQHIWEGVSVEDQANKYRIDILRQTPAALRFLSIEPLLEDIGQLDLTGIHWVIVGGESGPDARPFDIDWARTPVRQCKAADVACFVKQLGARPVHSAPGCLETQYPLKHSKGGDWDEWPEDLRVREFPLSKGPS